jgi:7-cyano-7-deazaguanine reductase
LNRSNKSILGQKTNYPSEYNPKILQAIPRDQKRKEIDYLANASGKDLWTIFEFSYLNKNGLPVRKCLSIEYDSNTDYIVESKSLKYYFNSINQFIEIDEEMTLRTISNDLSSCIKGDAAIRLSETINTLSTLPPLNFELLEKNSELKDFSYTYNPKLLKKDFSNTVLKTLCKIFKSNCLITGQADWATIYISISGDTNIERDSLLRYLVSYRLHNEFHEQCVERIISDLYRVSEAANITVYARFTRRGGIDINPIRWIGEVDSDLWEYYKSNRSLKSREYEQ